MLTKFLWFLLFIISLIGGIIGILLPIIPQVPFFLLALFSLSKFSPRFHRWLFQTRLLKRYVLPLLTDLNHKLIELKKVKQTWYYTLLNKILASLQAPENL
ncbi:DUF454 family protein [Ligilactobacillus sp. Marseille-Q7487]|uniref:DUF454 family protein n=1 Tax=Ligilactobacillus sp. Marseille-Q7487 TaxID=3022128 RepID=UPI0024A9C88F|nr:DUF454 family protein [Ligilactobacillus sp. Marseille-Q7487]